MSFLAYNPVSSQLKQLKQVTLRFGDGTSEAEVPVMVDPTTYNSVVIKKDPSVVSNIIKKYKEMMGPTRDNSSDGKKSDESGAAPQDASKNDGEQPAKKFKAAKSEDSEEVNVEFEPAQPSTQPGTQQTKAPIWSNNKSANGRAQDKAATAKLLELIGSKKYQRMLKDTKTKKNVVWTQIARDLDEAGFNLDINKGGLKCDQKFRNLERGYKEYTVCAKASGGRSIKNPPEFYDELHNLFKEKHSAVPATPEDIMISINPDQSPSTPITRSKITKSQKEILDYLQNMQEDEMERQETMMKTLESYTEMNLKRQKDRDEQKQKEFATMQEIHKERMEIQRSMIAAIASNANSSDRRRSDVRGAAPHTDSGQHAGIGNLKATIPVGSEVFNIQPAQQSTAPVWSYNITPAEKTQDGDDTIRLTRPDQNSLNQFSFNTKGKSKSQKEILEVLKCMRNDEIERHQSMMKTIESYMEMSLTRQRERDEQQQREFACIQQMHNERMEVQRAMIAAISSDGT